MLAEKVENKVEKIIPFKNGTVQQIKEGIYIYEEFEMFIKLKGQQSKNTAIKYNKEIKDFVEYRFGKEIKYLTLEEILKVTRNNLISFREYLLDKKLSNNTINGYISTLKSFFTHLRGTSKEYKEINLQVFKFPRLAAGKNRAGSVDFIEGEIIAQAVFETEREKSLIKNLLIRTAIRTSLRVSALLDLRWSNFREEKDGHYSIRKDDKTGESLNGVHRNFYNELLKIKVDGKDKIFDISYNTVCDTFERIKEYLGVPENRNVRFHSLRAIAPNWELQKTGDIVRAMRQSNHHSLKTFYDYYINSNENVSELAGVRMDEVTDLSILDNLTKEQLLTIIKDSSEKTVDELLQKAKHTFGLL